MDVQRYHVFARKLSWYSIGVSMINSTEKLKDRTKIQNS